MFTLLNILLLAVLVLLVLLTAVSASMSSHPTIDADLKDAIPANDNHWIGDGNTGGPPPFQTGSPVARASPGQYQSNNSRATLTMRAASTPE